MTTIRLCDIGELGLLERLHPFCAPGIVGDDAAVVDLAPSHQLVVTTDVLVDGVHFSDRTTSPEDAGWRAVAANLSDLAAMGAEPLGITVGLSLPGDYPVAWVEALYHGIQTCLQAFGGRIVGGDICRSPVATLAIAAYGQVLPQKVLRRSAAQIGQYLVATGYHGLSRAGLEILLNPDVATGLEEYSSPTDPFAHHTRYLQAHQRPRPRLDVLPILDQWITQTRLVSWTAIAAMDTSDGLANAVLQLCQASQVGAIVWASKLPIPDHLSQWRGSAQALDWCLYGGEDFELLLSVPPTLAQHLQQTLGPEASIVGEIVPYQQPQVRLLTDEHDLIGQALSLNHGFQHF